MKLTTKLQLGFALPTAFLVILGVASISGFWRINRQVETIYDDRVVPLKQLKSISDDYAVLIIDAVNKANEGIITTNDALGNIEKAQERIEKNWEEYKKTRLTTEEGRLANEVERLFDLANQEINQLIRVLKSGNTEALEEFDGELYQVIDPLTAKIEELTELQLRVAQEERSDAEEIYQGILWTFIPLLVVTVILVISPIRIFISKAIIAALRDTINSVASAATEIAAASSEQERIADEQASSVNKTTTTMDELRVSSQQSAQQAETAAAGAQQVLALSNQGNQAVTETLTGMSDLKEKVEEIAISISELNDKLNQVNTYQKLVSEIANQTNMLALNAAVEAVRAGEHGKGFAVVAAEIRKLADQSKQSAHNINTLVADIQTAIQTTIQVTESGTQTVERGVILAEATANTFSHVSSAVEEVTISVQQISFNAKQQAAGIAQVVEAMGSLNQGAVESATGISQTKVGTEKLNDTAISLKAMV